MKKLISVFLILATFSNVAFADCDFKTIEKLPDGRFAYTPECHLKVGQMKRDLEIANQQNSDYKQAITLKDLALDKAQQRIDLWQDTSDKLENRINAIDGMEKKNNILYFGLGILVTGLAVWGAGQLAHH